MSEGSMSNMAIPSGPVPVGVSSGGQEEDDDEQGDSQESFMLVWLPVETQVEEHIQFHGVFHPYAH